MAFSSRASYRSFGDGRRQTSCFNGEYHLRIAVVLRCGLDAMPTYSRTIRHFLRVLRRISRSLIDISQYLFDSVSSFHHIVRRRDRWIRWSLSLQEWLYWWILKAVKAVDNMWSALHRWPSPPEELKNCIRLETLFLVNQRLTYHVHVHDRSHDIRSIKIVHHDYVLSVTKIANSWCWWFWYSATMSRYCNQPKLSEVINYFMTSLSKQLG